MTADYQLSSSTRSEEKSLDVPNSLKKKAVEIYGPMFTISLPFDSQGFPKQLTTAGF